MTIRIGSGYDVHAFAPNRPLILGGIQIPHEYGLVGHSDADAVLHSIVNALLGAAALGDIGQHFPSEDPRWKDQPSTVFLDYTHNLIQQQGWHIGNIDVTIVAQRPKIAPHALAMRECIAKRLSLDISQVSIKAATTDGMGFVGRKEGIACQAVALLEK
ncbi:2-C-methyl-D-erythritol 2,4-cyclodiphosphate synthase [Ktedonospora formicarum]|uniref:2-C-methyl-D-erythritol 2,4-cyclodiphosphate synthase n=1 Tax=Ktedonospora formicarum TaxID=2778364 RepID=A0A8J3I2P0_9CHLR|nr:2-C-methyl-D-erythritol 2,4-cyclodiphosphate synthase [Ktedonospora formicarum]GHO45127.1 2-C-methyl-D-erythritol 2,4-cyclodiphosphate synthase [Ktedonospora formicarum]